MPKLKPPENYREVKVLKCCGNCEYLVALGVENWHERFACEREEEPGDLQEWSDIDVDMFVCDGHKTRKDNE